MFLYGIELKDDKMVDNVNGLNSMFRVLLTFAAIILIRLGLPPYQSMLLNALKYWDEIH